MNPDFDSRDSLDGAVHQFQCVGQFFRGIFSRSQCGTHERLCTLATIHHLSQNWLVKLHEISPSLTQRNDLAAYDLTHFNPEILNIRGHVVGEYCEPAG